ncbi:MAG: DMT family transporter [Spirochaetaceae bacterium]|jgi:drug/metabolite transporter (DMT)-like permease|nr:DMT family transporter [Spirochaetaceae bacterium]
MNKQALRADILLLLTSCIWGFGFVAQRSGMEYVGPFAFNGIRFILGSLSLFPLIFFRQWKISGRFGGPGGRRAAVLPSLAAGSCLFIAVTLQQLGLIFTTAGNAGFITGLYVVLVPILGIFLGRKTGLPTWTGAVFTLTGLYFLSASGHLKAVNPGDLITAVSAVFWAFHVLLIDALVQRTDPLLLSSGQFGWCGLCSLAAAFLVEPLIGGWVERLNPALLASGIFSWRSLPALIAAPPSGTALLAGLIPLLYGGLASVGIAYTLQVVAQQHAPPAHATIILCLEGCFAALGGVLILGEGLGTWTILGFVLMFCGMLITQWELIMGGPRKKKAENG